MKKFSLLLCSLFAVLLFAQAAGAAQYANWREITDEMTVVLDQSYDVYFNTKDAEKAKDLVNKAYFEYYEKLGVERAVMAYVSGKRASVVEYQFAEVKRLMTDGAPNKEVRASLDNLNKMLRDDGNALDGREESGWSMFVASLLIILREGLEAILVVAAIAAYLVRSGNAALTRVVYSNGAAAVLVSAGMAIALQKLFSVSGANQEILEGATMLLAVAVLFAVSNWMVSKAEVQAWKQYIENKVSSAVSTGSAFALGAAAFLAVFREGAETILFYQALLADAKDHVDMVWYGFGVGAVCLALLFMVIRYGSLRIPLRPFFIGTSILMYIMAIAFAGGGIKELQEADVVSVTPVANMFTVDLLGIYPTVETLIPQVVLVGLAVFSYIFYRRKAAAGATA
ncbi:MAG: FTR1 family iron permease [Deltaproteobacteria bacterium]|jgi:high-affinity iron transporter|nr:FTR1 family iron permease [Deltaproteobacteria bacterium]